MMLSDNGSQFVNEVIAAYAALVGSRKLETLAYSHEENGSVERANREVMRHVRTMIIETKLKKHWSEMLPDVERILNSTFHTAIGCSPADIVFGRSVNLARGFITPTDEGLIPDRPDYAEFIKRQRAFQMEVITYAQRALTDRARASVREAFGGFGQEMTPPTITVYPENTFVMMRVDSNKRNRREDKLSPNWTGPYRVIRSTQLGRHYEVLEIHSGKILKVHVSELKAFNYDPANDPTLDAIRDDKQYLVESIVDHRRRLVNNHTPGVKNRKEYEFLVHWQDYPVEDRSWEPVQLLRTLGVWHVYCHQNGLTSLVPKRFR